MYMYTSTRVHYMQYQNGAGLIWKYVLLRYGLVEILVDGWYDGSFAKTEKLRIYGNAFIDPNNAVIHYVQGVPYIIK